MRPSIKSGSVIKGSPVYGYSNLSPSFCSWGYRQLTLRFLTADWDCLLACLVCLLTVLLPWIVRKCASDEARSCKEQGRRRANKHYPFIFPSIGRNVAISVRCWKWDDLSPVTRSSPSARWRALNITPWSGLIGAFLLFLGEGTRCNYGNYGDWWDRLTRVMCTT